MSELARCPKYKFYNFDRKRDRHRVYLCTQIYYVYETMCHKEHS